MESAREWAKAGFFRAITGFPEKEWRDRDDRRKQIEVTGGGPGPDGWKLSIRNPHSGREFACAPAEVCVKDRRVVFEVRTREGGYRPGRGSIKGVDVAALQAQEGNGGAVFQVASNFNAVECINEGTSPSNGSFTENYVFDLTQGPAASISAGPAAIARVHFPFFDPSRELTAWGQTRDRQVEMLGDLREYLPVVNGYVVLRGREAPVPSREDEAERDKLRRRVRVAIHKEVEITTGFRQHPCKAGQLVDQVFCAAVNVQQGVSGRRNASEPGAEEKCRLVLEAEYEGTYLAAIRNGRRTIFLTLIGGGVFGNKKEWIVDAILRAHLLWADHPSSGLERVVLVCYSPSDVPRGIKDTLEAHGVPFELSYT